MLRHFGHRLCDCFTAMQIILFQRVGIDTQCHIRTSVSCSLGCIGNADMINEDDTPIIPEANKKRSVFKSVSSLSQRWVGLRRGSEISLETQLKIIPYVNCTVQFLNNDNVEIRKTYTN